MSQEMPARYTRNASFEALRLLAAVGIAIFHAFLPWDTAEVVRALGPGSHPALLLFLGVVSLLGACGNHAFFLISGYFLVPRCAEEDEQNVAWAERFARAGQRTAKLLLTVAFWWVVVAVAMPILAPDVERVWLSPTWLLTGLEFVWLYVVAIVLSPVFGWLRAQQRSWIPVVLVGVAIYATNAYIAATSSSDAVRTLFDWRKQMSAVTYLYSFYAASAIHDAVARGREAKCTSWVPLVAAIACTLVAEGLAASCSSIHALEILSYKSTSLLAFALAVGAVYLAGCRAARAHSEPSRFARIICELSPSVIGFYVLQSLTWNQWNALFWGRLAAALSRGAASFLLTGITLALMLVSAYLLLDMVVRRPVFRVVARSA